MNTRSGSITITQVLGNKQRLDGGAMFGNAPRSVWEKWCVADEQSRIDLQCRCLLIEVEGKRILCETGIGAFFEPKLAARFGVMESSHVLLESLHALGLDHSEIDFVILSHLHFDHAGGLLPKYESGKDLANTSLLFPNAKYVVGQTAFDRSLKPHPRDRASFIPGLAEKLKDSGRLILINSSKDDRLFPDRLHFEFTNGHTPGQMHVAFRGDERTVFFAGDIIPGVAWIHLPITMGYDRFAELVIDEKEKLYQKITQLHWLVFYTHDQRIACSDIIKDATGKYVAAQPKTDLIRAKI